MALVWMEGSVVDVPDELAGSYTPFTPDAGFNGWTTPATVAKAEYPHFMGTGGALEEAAAQAGLPGYDFSEAAQRAMAYLPNGPQTGYNPEEYVYRVLQATGDPKLMAVAEQRSPTTNPAAWAQGAISGQNLEADLATQEAQEPSTLSDLIRFASMAATVATGAPALQGLSFANTIGASGLSQLAGGLEPGLTAAAGETGGAVGVGGNQGVLEQLAQQAAPQVAAPVVTALPPPPTIAPPVDISNAAGGFTVPSIGSTAPYTGGLSLPSTLGTASPSLGFGITPAAVDAFTPAAAGSFLGAATPEIASGIANAGSTAAGLGGGSFLGGTAPGALTNILSGLGTASGLSSVPIPPGMYVDLNYHNNEMPLAGPATGYDANPDPGITDTGVNRDVPGVPTPDFGALAGTAAGTAAKTALQKALDGTATADDWAQLAGQIAPGVIGAFGANEQANAIKDQTKTLSDLAAKYDAYGAPSRARYEASMTPGFDPTTIPGYRGALDTASETLLRRLSAQNGNPYGNPGGMIEANKQIVAGTALPAVQQYQNQNANTGALGQLASAQVGANSAVNNSAMAGINANSGIWNALGSAAGNVFNPPQTSAQALADIYKLINSGMKVA